MQATAKEGKVVRVGVVQAGSVLFDTKETLKKCIGLIEKATAKGSVDLLVFPEAFIGGYPRSLDFGVAVGSRTAEGRKLFREYYENAIEVPGSFNVALIINQSRRM